MKLLVSRGEIDSRLVVGASAARCNAYHCVETVENIKLLQGFRGIPHFFDTAERTLISEASHRTDSLAV